VGLLGLADALGEIGDLAVLHDARADDLVVEVGLEVLEGQRVVEDLDVAAVAALPRGLGGGGGLLVVASAARGQQHARGAGRSGGAHGAQEVLARGLVFARRERAIASIWILHGGLLVRVCLTLRSRPAIGSRAPAARLLSFPPPPWTPEPSS
jgi:hypothetical protein